MIVSVCADKGAAGVSELATVLGLVWPGPRLVLEADCSGADLPFRLTHGDGDRLLDAHPSVLSLAADARGALPDGGVLRYTQPTSLGLPVLPGALSAEGFAAMARLWPRVAELAAGWDGTVIADLGRFQPGDPAAPVAKASTVLLLLARPDLAGLHHLRDRVAELAATYGDPAAERNPVAVVVRAPVGHAGKTAVGQVRQLLEAAGSPISVVGVFADDPAGVALLHAGQLSRRLLGSELVRSGRLLAETVVSWWPQLAQPELTATTAPPAVAVAPPAGRLIRGLRTLRRTQEATADQGTAPMDTSPGHPSPVGSSPIDAPPVASSMPVQVGQMPV